MSFESDILAWADKALNKASDNTAQVFSELATATVTYSPNKPDAVYSKGLLINQWYPAIGNTPSANKGSSTNLTGAESLSRIKDILAQKPFLGKDNTLSLANNIDYAYRADKLGWPMGEGTNGWLWSGRVGPYNMTSLALQQTIGKYA